jgi:predicted PolB exonuclease-like 3'-5' exonuclease
VWLSKIAADERRRAERGIIFRVGSERFPWEVLVWETRQVVLMAGYRVFDIETVVDRRYWDPSPSKWMEKPFQPPTLPSPYFSGQVPTVWEEQEPFPPPQAHRVVAMAWVNLSGDDDKWYSFESTTSLCDWSYLVDADEVERKMLAAFGEQQSSDEACIVTWNGRTFDLPVVNLRSFLHRLPCEWYYKERDVRYRYTEAGHCDLMDFFGDYGAGRSMKLGDVAKLCGLPGKIGDVDGKGVKGIYDAFNLELSHDAQSVATIGKIKTLTAGKVAVGAYCLLDAMQTAVIFGRSRVHKGMISQDYYDTVVAPSFKGPLADAIAAVAGRKIP